MTITCLHTLVGLVPARKLLDLELVRDLVRRHQGDGHRRGRQRTRRLVLLLDARLDGVGGDEDARVTDMTDAVDAPPTMPLLAVLDEDAAALEQKAAEADGAELACVYKCSRRSVSPTTRAAPDGLEALATGTCSPTDQYSNQNLNVTPELAREGRVGEARVDRHRLEGRLDRPLAD